MRSLFLRTFFWFCGATLLIVVIVSVGFLADSPGAFATNWREFGAGALVSIGRTAVKHYVEGGEAEATRYLESLTRDTGVRAALLDDSRRKLDRTSFTPDTSVSAAFRAGSELAFYARRQLAVVRVAGGDGRMYWFAVALPPRERGPWARVFLLLLAAVGGFVCYLLARHVTAPIVDLRRAASRFSEGDLSARIDSPGVIHRRDEIGGLARDFNQMASRIETLVKAQQRLVADASHELRSPLTRLGLALGLLRRPGSDPASSIARMERELERLNLLVTQLLTLSRLECLEQPPPMEPFDLAALVREIAADAAFEAAAQDRTVQIAECAPCIVRGSRELVASAIENALRNAVRFTRPETAVSVRLKKAGTTATVIVEDQGPGVPATDLPHLFDPFYRVDQARERQTGGAGLGLAITRRVVDLHRGAVSVRNRESGGLELRIDLPCV